jgi:hypothetical protein
MAVEEMTVDNYFRLQAGNRHRHVAPKIRAFWPPCKPTPFFSKPRTDHDEGCSEPWRAGLRHHGHVRLAGDKQISGGVEFPVKELLNLNKFKIELFFCEQVL